jgi:hypothetical protein
MRHCFILAAVLLSSQSLAAQEPAIKVQETDAYILIDTDSLQAKIHKKNYVSGIGAGSFLDKKTGARDAGFGLHIMDFLLGPGWKDDAYPRDAKNHGNLPKHFGHPANRI